MHPSVVIDQAIGEVDRLLDAVKKFPLQVRSKENQNTVKAHVFAWFKTHRPQLTSLNSNPSLDSVDGSFREVLEHSGNPTRRARYIVLLRRIRTELITLRSEATKIKDGSTSRLRPNFSKLVADAQMAGILTRRWDETIVCLENKAPLAATVMMGAILEALFLTRINQLADKDPIFKLKSTPISKKTKTPLPLQEWGLNDYIEVSFEMGWIRKPAKETGGVMRDYRNLIHPAKELSGGYHVQDADARMFWPIFEQLALQIIESA